MRQNRILVTKDHFLYIAACDKTGDELWAGYEKGFPIQTANVIGIQVKGSTNTFSRDEHETWNAHQSGEGPVAIVRKDLANFGLVASSNCVVFASVIPREYFFSAQFNKLLLVTASPREAHEISTERDKTVDLRLKCKSYQKRDLNTFDHVVYDDLDTDTISDSDIDIVYVGEN